MHIEICSAIHSCSILITVPEFNNAQYEYYVTCKDQKVICFCCDKITRKVISCNEVCTEPWFSDTLPVSSQARLLSKYVYAIKDMVVNRCDHVLASNSIPKLRALKNDLQYGIEKLAS